ncbi:MAG: glycosyltransferase [Chitinispirillia bacterium]|nr:glycosyltransferase [Chitinispirillia bacterium]
MDSIDNVQNPGGSLDGLTLLRFTYSFYRGGGIEQYLLDLNSALLAAHNMTIIHIHYKKGLKYPKQRVAEIGKGRVVYVALPPAIPKFQEWNGTARKESFFTSTIKRLFRERVLYNPLFGRFFLTYRNALSAKPLGMSAKEADELFNKLHRNFNIDLIMFHCLGGFDTAKIIELAAQRGIPYAYMNHYANDKLRHVCIREQIRGAGGVAGVSSCAVPKYIKKRFVNLHDGIDINFFHRNRTSNFSQVSFRNTVLLPARICAGKGHMDLLKAALMLKKEGLEINLVFAGRNDSEEIYSYIRNLTLKHGLTEQVFFAGHCSSEKLRDLYAMCAITVLPSRSEGFARVLLESQAMSTPVVAYNVGGVSQTIIDGKSGYLCKFKDVKKLKSSIKKLLQNEVLRKEMGEAGRQFVADNFTLRHLADRHRQYYLDVLDGHPSLL